MTEPKTAEQKTTEKANPDIPLSKAVSIVLKAISDEESRLTEIANSPDYGTTSLECETFTGYRVDVLADSDKVARILLKYQYPFYNTLEKDVPRGMWKELAEMVGVRDVYSVEDL